MDLFARHRLAFDDEARARFRDDVEHEPHRLGRVARPMNDDPSRFAGSLPQREYVVQVGQRAPSEERGFVA